jgi:AAA+ ATPase superfamily predicted ATPase
LHVFGEALVSQLGGKMTKFIGREEELKILATLLKKKSASLAVIRGRRRIGKSRLIEEFAKKNHFDNVYIISGIAPTEKTTDQSQRDEFASQLSTQTGLPEIKADDWNKLFLLLAEKVKALRTILVFDEISWMGSKDPDFLGKLKNAWDLHFKKNSKLIFILCGSVSIWIEKNILSNTGFLGRVSLDLILKELPLSDCNKFWGTQAKHISSYEKLKILAITGGVPLYLEHIDPTISAEENISQLCLMPHGILFNEFDKLFSDLFAKRFEKYRAIVQCLADHAASQDEICKCLKLQRSSDIAEYLDDLMKAGFISRDYTWHIKDSSFSKLSQYRLSDNYARFYLKYILPNREKIAHAQLKTFSINNLPNWSTVIGFQFENLVLNNRWLLWKILSIDPADIVCNNPYFQRTTSRFPGCQIDYMIQTKHNTLYICEIKFSKNELKMDVVHEVQKKIDNLALPKNFSYRPVLIHVNGVQETVIDCGFFAAIVDFGEFLNKNSM